MIRAFKEKNPQTRLIWATGANPSVFSKSLSSIADSYFDEIHEITGIGSFSNGKSSKLSNVFDAIVCTESSISNSFFLRRFKARTFISPAAGFIFSSKRPKARYSKQTVYEKFLTLMNLVSRKKLEPDLNLPIPQIYLDYANDRLQGDQNFVGLVPGAGAPEKQWPLEFYIEIAKLLAKNNLVPTFFLGPLEKNLKPELKNQIPSSIFPEFDFKKQQNWSSLLTVALAQKLSFSVVNDSGGGHLIAAGRKKTITLFNGNRGIKFRSPFCEQIPLNALDFNVKKVREIPYQPVLETVKHTMGQLAERSR